VGVSLRLEQTLSFGKIYSLRQIARVLVDPAIIVLSLFICAIVIEGKLNPEYVLLAIVVFAVAFPGKWNIGQSVGAGLREVLSQWFLIVLLLLALGHFARYLSVFSSEVMLYWFIAWPVSILVGRWFLEQYLSSDSYISKINKSAVIVGNSKLGRQLATSINQNASFGIRVKGFFDDNEDHLISSNIIGYIEALPEYVKRHSIDIIYIALPPSGNSRVLSLLDRLKDTTASIYYVPDFFITDLIQARVDEVDGIPVVAMCETPFTGINGMIKRMSDLLLGTSILLFLSPLMLLVAIGVKMTSPGPVIFRQRRYGLDGREIVVYKFRSMTVMEDGLDIPQAQFNDKRVTRFGKFIRRTSLDELPQFFNVIQGQMSIVGPRPHAITHNEMYRKLIKGYMVRHKVKPGITGWAQVNGHRGETSSLDAMQKRIDFDLEYLKNWSVQMDFVIIFKTISCVFKDSKAY
jgi:putative colanic acid biosysnthesis UDP-glucose lipid carrier transferase